MILAGQDGQFGVRRTSMWNDPYELVDGGIQPLRLPTLPPGDYAVTFGIDDAQSSERFAVGSGQTEFTLSQFKMS